MKVILAFLLIGFALANDTKCTYDGKELSNDEVITVQNAFQIKCLTEDNGSWKTEIVGCVTPGGEKVNVGEKSDDGQKVHECIKNENGQVVLKESRGTKADCQGGHKSGETWTEKSFKFTCAEGGVTKFTHCVTADGVEIESGKTGKVGAIEMKCEQHANGTVSMSAANEPSSYECEAKDGTKKKNGEEYKEGNFVRKCGDYGIAKIVGCSAEGVTETIPINQNVTVGDFVHSCVKDGDKYSFKTFGKQKKSNVVPLCGHEGKTYKHGETFIKQDAFRVKCVTYPNLTTEHQVLSCITPAGIEIPIGRSVEEGELIYECTNGDVSLKTTPGKTAKCRKIYNVGEIWIEGLFKVRCEPYGKSSLVSCLSKDGVEIPLGQQRRIAAGYVMECVIVGDNVIMRPAKEAKCQTSSGETKNINDTWNEGNFVRRCESYGIGNIIGCHIENVGPIGINTNYTRGDYVHMCLKQGDQFYFKTVPK
ncbi:unnamed protein product [Caenorhabditis angaria]|uniref:Abnormal cell migration protein 18-like fibronectin type I domain-containing protein n=1 Tax=Caenorhabditis angaria TaxID=860376 RepID=A0A9P1IVF9_9PELO|nr:unnamed protein product [Caenorhabditis angaria]